jgi:hypothetical protein
MQSDEMGDRALSAIRSSKDYRGEMMWRVSALSRLICAGSLVVAGVIPAARADTTISAAASTIQLQDGQTSGPVRLIFKVVGLAGVQLSAAPDVQPFSTSQSGPALVVSGGPTKMASLKDGAFWQVPAEVNGLPLNSSFTAFVVVHVNDTIGEVLQYTVTNVLPAVDADVSPGSDTVFLEKSRETDFTVNVKGRPLRGLSVCQSTLADSNTGNHLGEQYFGMYLRSAEAAENPQTGSPYLTLSAASTKVHLFISPTFQDNGVFVGTVGLCSASKASVATLKLTVNSSTLGARILGAFLIFGGICVYVLIAVVLRQRSRQLMALLPTSRLVEALRELRSSTKLVSKQAKVQFPILLGSNGVAHSLDWLISQLSVTKLKAAGYLPPLLTNPFQPADIGTEYQQFIQGISAQELNLAIIVRDGLERVMSLWPNLDEQSARDGLVQLDKLALHADSADPMRPKVDAIVSGISARGENFSMALAEFAHSRAGRDSLPSVHEITVQLEYVSGIGWLIWAVLSFLIGCGVLILSNHGFGTWQDLSKCFLWGLGIQAAGQGLQSLTPASAVSSFSLQIGH